MITRSAIVTASLALVGAGVWSYAGARLAHDGKFEFQPNPLGIKRSPYGQVIAMAFQAPVDKDWHGGIEIHDGPHDHECEDAHCDHDHSAHDHSNHEACEDPDHHDHGHDHSDAEVCDCGHDHADAPASESHLLDRLESAVTMRTNPRAPTEAHKFYLRREIEDKLRFAYELDPSHYANYACYHLFLKEESLGTYRHAKGEKTRLMIDLAEKTMRYCLQQNHSDPRPALTGSAAAYNILEIMLEAEPGVYSIQDFDRRIAEFDHCLKRHFDLLGHSIESGRWDLLSPARQQEIQQRGKFTLKLRETVIATLARRHPGYTSPSAGL